MVSGLKSQSSAYRVATFITCIGPDALDVYNALPFETPADAQDIQKVLDLMEEHFIEETNTIYERYNFQKRQQKDSATIDQYVTALKTLARTCSFGTDADERLRDQIVYGVKPNVLRKQLLQKKGLTLAECLDMCRAYEATTQQLQMKVMTGEELAHFVSKRQTKPENSRKSSDKERKQTQRTLTGQSQSTPKPECQYCGLNMNEVRQVSCIRQRMHLLPQEKLLCSEVQIKATERHTTASTCSYQQR